MAALASALAPPSCFNVPSSGLTERSSRASPRLPSAVDRRTESELSRDPVPRALVSTGARKLRELTAADVRMALPKMAADYSRSAVTMGHLALKRAIRHAEANDLVSRNVATLVDTPKGQEGRPSKSLTAERAVAVINAAKALPAMELHPLKDVRRPAVLMHAYIVLSLLAGLRTEEARALCWQHLNLDGDPQATPPIPPHVAVWRSVRQHSETKTERSRRTLGLPHLAVEALRELRNPRQKNDSWPEKDGRTPGSYSRPSWAPPCTRRTSARCSSGCADWLNSETAGRHASS
jgi:integrase